MREREREKMTTNEKKETEQLEYLCASHKNKYNKTSTTLGEPEKT